VVEVESIHCKKLSTQIAFEGQFSSVSLIRNNLPLTNDDVRKGMYLLDYNSAVPSSCRSFLADIWSIDGSVKTIKYKYEPVVTIKHIRQTCKVKRPQISTNSNEDEESDSGNSKSSYKKEKKSSMKNVSDSYVISPDEATSVVFEFKNCPEYVREGSHLIINDHLKAFGIIKQIYK
jgi:GTPase